MYCLLLLRHLSSVGSGCSNSSSHHKKASV
jgi:hypothetical protein